MNKNTDKEKGMKMQVLNADREYFWCALKVHERLISTLKTILEKTSM